ncbi:MAG: hypothetical protein H7835_19195, partial [Magnetococcus sp. XQGC-1]
VPTVAYQGGQAQCFALQEYPSGVWNPNYQTWVNAGGFTVIPGACPSGYTENPTTHLCEAVIPCPTAGTSAIPSGQIGYGESAEGTNPVNAVLCGANQCGITIQQATAIPIGDGKQGNYIQQATYTGNKVTGVCPLIVIAPTPKDPTLPKPIDTVTPDANTPDGVPQKGEDCPPGSAFGQVNGVNVCSPSGSKISYVPETTTQTNNGQTTTSTVSKTSEVLPDGSIKTTSTITTSAGGVGSVTTTTKNTGGPSGLDGRDGKDGDGIDGIDLGPAPSAESANPVNFLPGPGPGQDGAGQAARTFTVQPKITGGSSACIADRSVTAMGVTVTIPLSALCPWFAVMYNLVSAFAVFSALRILVMS